MTAKDSTLRKLLHGSLTTLTCRFIQAICMVLALALLARATPPQIMGEYFVAHAMAVLVAVVSPLGLQGLALREVGRRSTCGDSSSATEWAASAIKVCVCAGVVITLAMVAISATLPSGVFALASRPYVVALAGAIGILTGLQSLTAEVHRARGDIGRAAIFGGMTTALFFFLLVVVMTRIDARMYIGTVLGMLCGASALSVIASARLLNLRFSRPPSRHGIRLKDGRHFLVNGLAILALYQSDIWVAGALLAPPAIAFYGAAARLAQVMLMAIESSEATLPPLIIRSFYKGDLFTLQREINAAAWIQTIGITFGLVVVTVAGDVLLARVFGALYSDSSPMLLALAAGLLVRGMAGPFPHVLMLCGREQAVSRLTLCTVALGTALMALMANNLGAVGLAAGAAITLAVYSVAGVWVCKRLVGVDPSIAGLVFDRQKGDNA